MNASAEVRTSARKAIKTLGNAVPNKNDLDRILRKVLNDNAIKKIKTIVAEPVVPVKSAVKRKRPARLMDEPASDSEQFEPISPLKYPEAKSVSPKRLIKPRRR